MFAPIPSSLPAGQVALTLPLATQSFLAGILVALALLAVLAYRPLRDPILSKVGLFGLTAAAAWISFSDIAASLLPGSLIPAIHATSLVFAGASLVVWERVTADLLATSPGAQRLALARRFTALCAFGIALAALAPWEPSYRISRLLFGLLVALLALLTLTAGLRARRDGLGSAWAVVAVSLALLVRCASLGATSAGWMSRAASLNILQFVILVFALALGWAMLSRMKDLRRATEAAQAAQLAEAARQTKDLEVLVRARNAELSERIMDLNEARRSAERANQSLQRALVQLEQTASTDRLTGAWNRRRFEEAVHSEIALAHRRRDPLSLLMIDMDHFKRINDTFGHGAGDIVLAGMVQAVRLCLRASDALVRWGGEEFLVMAPATHLKGAMDLAEKLRATVAAIDFPGVGTVTMSLGVSEYALEEELEEWIDRTDKALYRAKSEGRNRVVAASPSNRSGIESSSERSLLEVTWEDTYASGVALIDAQHQRLFRLASALMSVLTEKRPLPEVSLRLESLLAHTAQHFHDEEALLREAHFPGHAEHADIHANLLNRARMLQTDVQMGRLDFGKLVTFLTLDLVKGHILSEDRNYFSHMTATSEPEGASPAGA